MRVSTTAGALWLSVLLTLGAAAPLGAQTIREMEFKNQPITDILLALAQMAGKSIVPDDTVTGNASYYFSQIDLDAALSLFLTAYGYYFWEKDGVYYVSRLRLVYDSARDQLKIDSNDVPIPSIVRTLSTTIGKTILFDALPQDRLTLHSAAISPAEVLTLLVKRFPEYSVEQDKAFFYVKRRPVEAQPVAGVGRAQDALTRTGDTYSISAPQVRFRDAVQSLFRQAGREYSLLGQNDPVLANLYFKDKSFEEMLQLIADQAACGFVKVGEIYYVYDVQRKDVLNKLESTVLVPLKHLSVSDLPGLLPPDLVSSGSFKTDAGTNSVILYGNIQQIGPLQDFLLKIDRPLTASRYYRFDLAYTSAQDFIKLLPPRLAGASTILLTNSSSFIMLLDPEKKPIVDDYIALVDRPQAGSPIRLKFVRVDDLLKNLPPAVDKSRIAQTSNPSIIFFTGTEDQRKLFQKQLDVIDRPVPQIKYELLVIQHQQGEQFSSEASVTSNTVSSYVAGGSGGAGAAQPQTAFLGSIGKLLSLNFDILSVFGYVFSFNLNIGLTNGTAHILADTTLNGLSGQEIKFQNTETFRYRDTYINPDTGKVDPNGVVRQITAGLIISINGWVSGDGMITMDVNATISKQGADTSATGGTLPPTSEKVVTTHVRTKVGTPVILSGLIQQDNENTVEKVPLLGDIPLIGFFFQKRTKSVQNTEMQVTILPHIEYPTDTQVSDEMRLQSLYERFVKVPPQ